MKYKNLLVLLSIFGVNAAKEEASLFNRVLSSEASIGRIELAYKGVWYDNAMLIGGIDSSLNFYGGVGYFNAFELGDWTINFKLTLYCFDWANKEFSAHYLQKMPLNLSFSTPIWGFTVGGFVSVSLNKKWLAGAFLNIRASDNIDVDIFAHMKGASDFFSKDVFDRAKIERWVRHNQKIVDDFQAYVEGITQSNEVSQEIIKIIVEQAKNNVVIGNYTLGKVKLSKKEQLRIEKACALLIMGNSGSGKTFIAQGLLKKFVKREDLDTISLISVNANAFTPQGYQGGKADKTVTDAIEKEVKNGKSTLSVHRAYVLVDEIDSISSGKANHEEFYSKVQKEMLEFVDGEKIYNTIYGPFKLSGALKLLPGAYAKSANDLENLAYQNVFEKFKSSFLSSQVNGLKGYIKTYYKEVYTESLYQQCNVLFQNCEKFSQNLENILKNNSIIANVKNGQEFIKAIKEHSIFEDWIGDESLKKIAGDISLLANNIKAYLEKNNIDFKNSFDDFYVRFLSGVQSIQYDLFESNDIGRNFVRYVERAAEFDKRYNTCDYIIHAGMGREIVRRSAKVFYLEDPSHLRAMRYFRQELDSFLDNNNILFADYTNEDRYDRYYETLLDFDGNSDAKHTYNELFSILKREKEDLDLVKDLGKTINLKKYGEKYHFEALKDGRITVEEVEKEIKSLEQKILDQKEVLKELNAKNTKDDNKKDKDIKAFDEFVTDYEKTVCSEKKIEFYQNAKKSVEAQLSLCKKCQFMREEFMKLYSREKSKEIILDDWIKSIADAELYFGGKTDPSDIINQLCKSKEIKYLNNISQEMDKFKALLNLLEECNKLKAALEKIKASNKTDNKDLQRLESKFQSIKSKNEDIIVNKKEEKKAAFSLQDVFSLG